MNTVLLALGAALAAGALTWFFCLRPMRRSRRAHGASCCAPAEEASIEDQIRAARAELARLHTATPSAGARPPSRHEP
ncbi:hypothetical protein [Arthrobacter sp. A2-55]|uniref:hypothetical protein n=1 Tax=Arthrobacter sp. A2-55 TaxID=2897337 RepID=UPI0021CDE7F3|nr:hypothetical protein [Arthrobacter sp. A2-55]MCU6481799.1 hypothetical protein [Arthrobacter sp. A2-55]